MPAEWPIPSTIILLESEPFLSNPIAMLLPTWQPVRCAARGADLVVAETESEANIIRGTALDAIFELQVNQAGTVGGTWEMTDELKQLGNAKT